MLALTNQNIDNATTQVFGVACLRLHRSPRYRLPSHDITYQSGPVTMMLQGEKKGWSLALSHLALLESRSLDMLAAVADQVITTRIAHLYSSPIIEFISVFFFLQFHSISVIFFFFLSHRIFYPMSGCLFVFFFSHKGEQVVSVSYVAR